MKKKKEKTTGVRFPPSILKKLRKLRVHPKEPYYNVVKRLIFFYEESFTIKRGKK